MWHDARFSNMKALLAIVVLTILLGVFLFWRRGRSVAANPEVEEPVVRVVSAEDAARRALCLLAVRFRGDIEQLLVSIKETRPDIFKESIQDFQGTDNKLKEKLKRDGLWASLSNNERKLLEKPLGSFSEQDLINVAWRAEALLVSLWALGKHSEIPSYDAQAADAAPALFENLRFPDSVSDYISKAVLRPEAEISKARNLAELWHWRARTTELQVKGDNYNLPPGLTIPQILAMTSEKAKEDGLFVPIRNDFPAFGKAYAELTEEEWSIMQSIAMERHYALNWLCGFASDWDKVRTDT